jgi:hypothetical protein
MLLNAQSRLKRLKNPQSYKLKKACKSLVKQLRLSKPYNILEKVNKINEAKKNNTFKVKTNITNEVKPNSNEDWKTCVENNEWKIFRKKISL